MHRNVHKLPSLVRYMNPGSSIMADKLIHELGHTFSTFPYQGLGLNEFTCVIYAGDNGVVPLCGHKQVGDEIDAKLSPGFKRYMHNFSLSPPFSNLEPAFTHWQASQLSTNCFTLFTIPGKKTLDVSRETVLSLPKWPLIALASTVVPTPSWDIQTNLHCSSSSIMTGTYLTHENCTTTMKFLDTYSIHINTYHSWAYIHIKFLGIHSVQINT